MVRRRNMPAIAAMVALFLIAGALAYAYVYWAAGQVSR